MFFVLMIYFSTQILGVTRTIHQEVYKYRTLSYPCLGGVADWDCRRKHFLILDWVSLMIKFATLYCLPYWQHIKLWSSLQVKHLTTTHPCHPHQMHNTFWYRQQCMSLWQIVVLIVFIWYCQIHQAWLLLETIRYLHS